MAAFIKHMERRHSGAFFPFDGNRGAVSASLPECSLRYQGVLTYADEEVPREVSCFWDLGIIRCSRRIARSLTDGHLRNLKLSKLGVKAWGLKYVDGMTSLGMMAYSRTFLVSGHS